MEPRVLVVGSINMDLIMRLKRVPRAGETVHGDEFHTAHGGKGANQAVACARLGARTSMIGCVGRDEFGGRLRAALEEEGIDVAGVRVDADVATGVALILVERGGQNRIVVAAGANWKLGDVDVQAAARVLPEVDAVLMPLELPLAVVMHVAAAARERGVLSVLDAGPVSREAAEAGLPAAVDVISPNETEAEALTGIAVRDVDSAARAARQLRAAGARDVVVKLGARGAYWAGEAGEDYFPAFGIDAVDTTAAGDAFSACLTVGLASGLAMPDAIRRAVAAGALACLKLGAQPSMPERAALDTFLRERGA